MSSSQPPLKAAAEAGVLREKQPNQVAKTPIGQPSARKIARVNTPQQQQQAPTDENLTQSQKRAAFNNRLKALNHAVAQHFASSASATATTGATSALTAHQLAHQSIAAAQNTPKRQMIPAPSQGSAKLDKKAVVKPKPVAEQKSVFGTPASVSNPTKSTVAAAAAKSTSFLTPTYRPTTTTKFGSASVARTNAETDVNPVWNGVDYSHMMAQKSQLGYTGPGYIVEYDCNEKYLKGLLIKKGLWKVTTSESKPRDSSLAYLGPPIFLSRIDVESDKNTPSRAANLTKFDFNWKQRFNTVAKSCDIASSSSTTHSLNLETNQHQKVKKQIRWAIDPLEAINENTSGSASVSSPALPPSHLEDTPRNMPSLDSPVNSTSRKSLRRSFSLGDVNEYLVDEYECATYAVATARNTSAAACVIAGHLSPLTDHSIERHDATFDLERPQYVGPLVDVTKSSPCYPQEAVPPCELHESEIKYTAPRGPETTLTPILDSKRVVIVEKMSRSPVSVSVGASGNETYCKSTESSLLVLQQPAIMVRSVSATSEDSIGFMQASRSNESSRLHPTTTSTTADKDKEESKHSLSLLNDDQSSLGSSKRDQAESSCLSLDLNASVEKEVAAAASAVLVKELAPVFDAVQTMTDQLSKSAYFGPLMQEIIVSDLNSSTLKTKFKKITTNSSLDFVQCFNQLDLAEKLIRICKANLKLE